MKNMTKLVNLKLVNSNLYSNVDLIDEINNSQPIAQNYGSTISKFNKVLLTDDKDTHLYNTLVKLEVNSAIVKDDENVKDDEEIDEKLFENDAKLLFKISIEYRIVFELLDDSIDLSDDDQVSVVQTDIMNQFQPYMRSTLQNMTSDSYFYNDMIPVKLF